MAKIDKIKEFIGFLKAIFITSIVMMSSLIAYLYNKSIEDNYIVILAIVINFLVVILLFKKIMKEINLLEDLE
jgi:predicted benzoate:H+ symporter BenE